MTRPPVGDCDRLHASRAVLDLDEALDFYTTGRQPGEPVALPAGGAAR